MRTPDAGGFQSKFTYDAWFRVYYQVYTRVTVLQVLHYLYLGLGLGVGLGLVHVCNTM
jgi:hypothetical protein